MKIISNEYFGESRHNSLDLETSKRLSEVRELLDTGYKSQISDEQLEQMVCMTMCPEYLGRVRHWSDACAPGMKRILTQDTWVTYDSYELAMLATRCVVEASDFAQRGSNAFAIVRPPGHHATRNRAGGFCIINNMGVAIEYLASIDPQNRILVLDVDVHMGDGTREIIRSSAYRDRLGMLDLFQSGIYPFKEPMNEGNICQVGLHYGSGNDVWQKHVRSLFYEQLDHFQPSIIGLSLGFDTADLDMDAVEEGVGFSLTEHSYVFLRELLDQTNIPYFGILEGGYRPESIKMGLDTFLGITFEHS